VERSAVSAVPSRECFPTGRTRISYFALLASSTTHVAPRRESHMQIIRRVSDGRVDHLAVFGHLRCQWFIGDGLRFYQTADIAQLTCLGIRD
jgi:hypothetical protein